MNDNPRDPSDPRDPNEPGDPKAGVGRKWLLAAQASVEDMAAVTKDLIRRKRRRRLGILEQRRLYREARRTLKELFAYALGSRDGEGSDPPAH
jgi:hypothetical protein